MRPLNTTLAVIATDAALTKTECARMAISGQDGLARAIDPVHQYVDGDVVFTLATGERPVPDAEGEPAAFSTGAPRPLQLNTIFAAGADTVSRAIVHAAISATSAGGLTSYLDRFPSARKSLRSPPCVGPAPAHRRLLVPVAALLSSTAVATTASATTVPEGDPDASVVAGFVIEPTNLDILHQSGIALDQLLLGNIYETLVKTTPDGEISPGLAELEISEDRLTYTLTLQEGVTFHDGDPLTASDVVWTLDQLRGEGGFEAPRLASVETVEATDDATVVITLTQPDNDLAFHLGQRAGAVLNEGATGLENSANGTGPFTLGEWNQGTSITLVRNDDYWGEPATISEITFQYFGDRFSAAANALARRRHRPPRQGRHRPGRAVRGQSRLQHHEGPTNGEFTLGMNNADEVLSDQRVRQAITQAIDKQGLIDLYRGYGTLIGAPVPPFEPWYEDLSGLYPFDPEAARALLEEAGYADGLELTFVAPNVYRPMRWTTSCRSSPTSASRSTLKPSSSRPGSTGCSSTTTTTSPSCSTPSLATSTTTPIPSTTGCTTAPRCRTCSRQAKSHPIPRSSSSCAVRQPG